MKQGHQGKEVIGSNDELPWNFLERNDMSLIS